MPGYRWYTGHVHRRKNQSRESECKGTETEIKDIINKLHTENIARVRIGISKNNITLADYVLGRFGKEDDEKVNSILPTIESIIDDFTKLSIDDLMQKYNRNNNE